MATQGLHPPYFSEDVAWLPCWLQNLRTNASNELIKESQAPYNEELKDLAPSQGNGNDGKDFDNISREEGRYKSCHLFLSGDNSSPVSVSSSPENVFHFSLHLSSDADSLFCPNQDLNESHDVVAPSKALSLQPVQPSSDFGVNMYPMMDPLACEPDPLVVLIPETVEKEATKSLVDTIDSVGQQKETSVGKCSKSADVSNAVELSIAASEALVIHDLVKMDSASETMHTESVLEVALRVKQARLKVLEDGFQFSNEESSCSDTLSDLNDFIMEDAYEDIGLPIGVPFEENIFNSAKFQAKAVSVFNAENVSGWNNKHGGNEFTSQLASFDDKSKQNQLEINVDMEMQQNTDSPLHSLHCEKGNHSDDPGLGANFLKFSDNSLPISHQCIQNSINNLPLNQTVGLVDLTSVKPPNSVNSSLDENSGNYKKEDWLTHLAPKRFRSCWLGGWSCEELDSSSLNQNDAERIPKFHIRETSFLTESVDVPDESSYVVKLDPKCAFGFLRSMPSEDSHNKLDEGILQSQDVFGCSGLSLTDPLCSVVPCSISSEHDNYKTYIDKNNDMKDFVPSVSEFEVDNFHGIPDKNVTFGCSNEKIMSVLDGKDIPITATKMAEKITKLTRAEHTCLKTYSMILPNQDPDLNCNLTALASNQSMGAAAPSGTKFSESLCASKHTDGNKNEENNQHLIDHKLIIEIIDGKSGDELKFKVANASDILGDSTQGRRSSLILNNQTCQHLLGPRNVVNDISEEKNMKQHEVPETVFQHPQKQVECNKFLRGHVRVRKQVHFSEKVEELPQKRKLSKLESSHKRCSSVRTKRRQVSKSLTTSGQRMKHSLANYCKSLVHEFIFQGIEFLLTGLSSQKERDVEALIRNSGGVVLYDVPSPRNSRDKRNSTISHMQLPIILCMKKLQTAKFLYGCAVGASILKVGWLTDCLASGTILQPEKYLILRNRNDMKWTRIGMAIHHRNGKHIFERVGIVLHGNHSFCAKLGSIIKHGGGKVFKTLQWLVRSADEERTMVGAIVVEEKTTISRHLKYCAKERNIPMMPSSWIIKSLYSGKLLPFTEEKNTHSLPFVKVSEVPSSSDMSEEI